MTKNNFVASMTSAFAALVLLVQPSMAQDGVTRTGDIVFAEVDGMDLMLDLYTPTGADNAPVLIFAHGGRWARGSRERVPHLDLVTAGYAIASVDYRLSGDAKFPAQIYDLKAAVRYLRANASELGIDPNRIGATGSSAGAHLAQLLGVTNGSAEHEGDVGDYDNVSSDVNVIVSYYGASDQHHMATGYAPPLLKRFSAGFPRRSRNSHTKRAQSSMSIQAIHRCICCMAIKIHKCRSIRAMRYTANMKRSACRFISKLCTARNMAERRSTIRHAPPRFRLSSTRISRTLISAEFCAAGR
jgi:acetyl esterase/lipase